MYSNKLYSFPNRSTENTNSFISIIILIHELITGYGHSPCLIFLGCIKEFKLTIFALIGYWKFKKKISKCPRTFSRPLRNLKAVKIGIPGSLRLRRTSSWKTFGIALSLKLMLVPDAKKVTKARAKIILLIEPINFVHVQSAKTAKEAWNNLERAFEDSGLTRRVGLLRTLINTRLEDSDSVEAYVTKVVNTAHKLRSVAMDVSDEWVGTLLLAGLSDEYRPMIMGLESSGTPITADSIKTKLLQDVKDDQAGSAVFFGKRKPTKKSRGPRCYECRDFGHISKNCPKKNTKCNEFKSKTHGLYTAFTTNAGNDDWYIDSGASAHMSMKRDCLTSLNQPVKSEIVCANNSRLSVKGIGDMKLQVAVQKDVKDVSINNILYIPDLCVNLLSVSQIVKKGNSVYFDSKGCQIFTNDKQLIATASHVGDMFKLNRPSVDVSMVGNVNVKKSKAEDSNLWHRRMGHLNFESLLKLRDCVPGFDLKKTSKEMSFKDKGTRATEVLEIIHGDLCGPIDVVSRGGARYIMVLVDDFSRKVFVYFLKAKSEAFEKFVEFKNLTERQLNKKMKILRTDNGTEFCNRSFDKLLKQNGIRHQTTTPYTPQQNGLAERTNRTLIERARCMLFDAGLDKKFWAEAVSTAVYVINRSPCQSTSGLTPEHTFSGKVPDLSRLRVFGCKAMVHIPKHCRKKFDPKSKCCVFLGYCEDTKGYRLYQPDKNEIIISRDVIFFENCRLDKKVIDANHTNYFYIFPDESNSVGNVVELDGNIDEIDVNVGEVDVDAGELVGDDGVLAVDVGEIDTNETHLKDNTTVENDNSFEQTIVISDTNSDACDTTTETFYSEEEEIDESSGSDVSYVPSIPISEVSVAEPRRSQRTPKPVRMDNFACQAKSTELYDPLTVQEALNRSDAKFWKAAMKEEYDSLIENQTWVLTDIPPKKRPIDCKWVFKTKKDATGKISRFKARLVIKGCAQKHGIDYEETYSPVVRYTSIRFLLAIAAKYNLDIDQMDAVCAFLQGELSEEIFMLQPEGFCDNSSKVCKLKKSLYGLKQASRIWNNKLDAALLKFGLSKSKVDPCVYYKISGDKMLYVAVYVDDLLILSNDEKQKLELKNNLKSNFKMKDIGEARFVLGIQIKRDRKKGMISLDQELYINEILSRFNTMDCNTVKMPSLRS